MPKVSEKVQILEIATKKIWPNPDQPRKESWGDLDGLKTTMKGRGLVQLPIVIKKKQPNGTGQFMLISGERRWRAAQKGNIKNLYCILRKDIKENDIFVLSVMENLQRQPLNPLEEAKAYTKLLQEFRGISIADLSQKLGISQPKIYNALNLLKLPPEIQAMVAKKEISPVTLSGVSAIGSKRDQISLAKEIARDRLTGKEAQDLILKKKVERGDTFRDGRTAKEVQYERNFSKFSNSVISLSDLHDFWVKLDNPGRKNFLGTIQKDKKLLRDLHYARTLLDQIGEKVD
ncbi:MAG: ParB/RepB/Spo0J family partition protein [Candidatus Parcubacteria bacterium]|nr:ParB/RepB/Spo0J family partition protein [Candidatus Parcubacteria bacterium]